MAEKSSFFNSVSGDRKYSAEDWAAYFASFVSNGTFASPSNSLQVVAATGMGITIKAGSGFLNGYYYRNTSDLNKTLAVADGVYSRIDRIVMRWSLINRTITVEVLQGSVATAPTAPALTRNAEVYELALADILVGAGVTSVLQSNITDRRGDSNLCGIVTSAVQQLDLTSFMAQFNAWMDDNEADFNEWFSDIQDQLSGDVAGNLQVQIDELKETKAGMYSPVIYTAVGLTLTAAHSGKTIVTNDWSDTVDVVLTITQSESVKMPLGMEIAVVRQGAKSVTIVFDATVRVRWVGADSITDGVAHRFAIPEVSGMVALKKIAVSDGLGDMWLLQGLYEEVVS